MSVTLKLFWVISTISIVVAVSLSCVYWPIIYNGRDRGINDVLTHAVNAIILFIDLFIHAHPPRFSHTIYPVLFGLTYITYSIIYTLSGGTDRDNENYIYSVIDWSHKSFDAFLFSTAIIIFSSAIHFLLTILIKFRIFVYQKMKQYHMTRNVTCNENENLGFEV
ncbi:hypothetical protein PVAND_010808 [Polypedilum vanderplanki]|uniref:Uncharacterized protein n=1 Tax=Polypedilum vanderplanki TaxID=319348 RepID=A0A9J6CIG4_POLVA|nr:hypothetical protein PVAND_010808 [Polypedilum vanderplanki]